LFELNLTLTFQKLVITLHESRNRDAILPILTQNNTAEMNLHTPGSLISLYPSVTSNKQSCKTYDGSTSKSDKKVKANGFEIISNNATWGTKCRESCPAIWRQSHNLKGAAILRFLDYEEHDLDEITNTHYMWRFGTFCVNKNCNYDLSYRKRY
jgi:hypothetical protein